MRSMLKSSAALHEFLRHVRSSELSPANSGSILHWGYRIISGAIWWSLYRQWRVYRAKLATATPSPSPILGPPGARGIYFTDKESLEGHEDPSKFGLRVGLSSQSQLDCHLYGCAIVGFAIQDKTRVTIPGAALPGCIQGLTVGGGREFFFNGNLTLNETMDIRYVDYLPGSSSSSYFILPL
jgi:hypothetical protein